MHYSIDNNILDYLLRCKTTYTQLYKKCSCQGWHKSSDIILFPILRYPFLENTQKTSEKPTDCLVAVTRLRSLRNALCGEWNLYLSLRICSHWEA